MAGLVYWFLVLIGWLLISGSVAVSSGIATGLLYAGIGVMVWSILTFVGWLTAV